MQKRYTVQEYAEKMQLNTSTIYRQVQQGKLTAQKIDGVLHILIDEAEMHTERAKMQNDVVAELRKRIEHLERENGAKNALIQRMQADAETAKERADTIILQLTQQNQLLLEDLRPKRRWYHKLFAWNNA